MLEPRTPCVTILMDVFFLLIITPYMWAPRYNAMTSLSQNKTASQWGRGLIVAALSQRRTWQRPWLARLTQLIKCFQNWRLCQFEYMSPGRIHNVDFRFDQSAILIMCKLNFIILTRTTMPNDRVSAHLWPLLLLQTVTIWYRHTRRLMIRLIVIWPNDALWWYVSEMLILRSESHHRVKYIQITDTLCRFKVRVISIFRFPS